MEHERVIRPLPLTRHRLERLLLAAAIVALAFNLRPVAISIGPVLDELRAGLGMSPTVAGVLTSMPVLAFALFGALAPWLGRQLGVHRLTLFSILAVVAGLVGRPFVESTTGFLAFTFLALAGAATANVHLPSLVKRHFPNRVGQLTSLYTTAIAIGITARWLSDGILQPRSTK